MLKKIVFLAAKIVISSHKYCDDAHFLSTIFNAAGGEQRE